jgi:uncharacterized secreted protein with C-terminal beta-propeller domain
MKRQTRQSFLNRAPLLVALFSILVPGRLVALDLDPVRVGGYDTSGEAYDVAVSGNYAYVADEEAGLQVIDISKPANPKRVGGYDTSGYAVGVAVSGNHAHVANYDSLQVIDISNPANPQRVGGCNIGAYGLTVSGNYAYVAGDGLQVIDVSNPASPQRVGGNSLYDAFDVAVAGSKVFLAGYSSGLIIFDLFHASLRLDPVSPQQAGEFRFLVRGDAGLSVRVQRSANLRDWEDWQALTLGAIPSELSDLDAGANPDHFYRAVTP